MKANKWLLILMVVLASVTVYFVATRKKSTLREELRNFAIKDTASISKIFLANRNGNTVTLDRKSDGTWTLNKSLDPKQDQIKVLMDCLYKIEVRSPVAKAAYNNVVKSLASSAIKC